MLINMDEITSETSLIIGSSLIKFKESFKSLGKNVLISDKAVFYGAERIEIGDNCRIDDFAILSAGKGGIVIDRYVHIACHATIIGQGRVYMGDYSGISSRVAVYSSSDNYDGEYMTNPCVPDNVKNTKHEEVWIGRHVVIGTGSTLLPGVHLSDGCAVGAMSLVRPGYYISNVILAGIPAIVKKPRKWTIYNLESKITHS